MIGDGEVDVVGSVDGSKFVEVHFDVGDEEVVGRFLEGEGLAKTEIFAAREDLLGELIGGDCLRAGFGGVFLDQAYVFDDHVGAIWDERGGECALGGEEYSVLNGGLFFVGGRGGKVVEPGLFEHAAGLKRGDAVGVALDADGDSGGADVELDGHCAFGVVGVGGVAIEQVFGVLIEQGLGLGSADEAGCIEDFDACDKSPGGGCDVDIIGVGGGAGSVAGSVT